MLLLLLLLLLHISPNFNPQATKLGPDTLKLLKLDKFGPLLGFKGGFPFSKNNKKPV
jgi:hypothetical protein